MSYILEALRKAEAERGRGSVPDLHAQLLPPGAPQAQAQVSRPAVSLWLGLGIGLALLAFASWWVFGRDEPTPKPPPVAATLAPPPPAPAVLSAAPPQPAAPTASAAPAMPEQPAAASAPAAVPRPVARTRTATAAGPSAKAPAVPQRRDSSPAPAASVPAAEPPAPPARLPQLAELPADLRQQVPPLVVGGSVYSPQASARMVVINGQVFQEGSNLGSELRLEQVRPKTAVLSIRGQRFELPL